jgi:glycosyltransferase 2 family protein
VPRLRPPRSRSARAGLLLLVLAAVAAVAVWRGPDIAEVAAAFERVDWWLVALAVLANVGSVVARATAWQLVLRQALRDPPGVAPVASAYSIGLLGNVVLPARAGEAARVGVLSRRIGRPGVWPAVAGSAAAQRLLEVVPTASLIGYLLLTAPVPGWARGLMVGLALGTGALLAIGVGVAQRRSSGDGDGWRAKLAVAREGLAVFRKPLPTAAALVAQVVSLAAQLAAIWLVLTAFDLDAPLQAAVLVLVMTELVLAFPFWPGNVGIYQAGVAGALLPYGIPSTTGLAVGVVTQVLDAAVALGLGSASLAREGMSLGRIRAAGREQAGPTPPRHEAVARPPRREPGTGRSGSN